MYISICMYVTFLSTKTFMTWRFGVSILLAVKFGQTAWQNAFVDHLLDFQPSKFKHKLLYFDLGIARSTYGSSDIDKEGLSYICMYMYIHEYMYMYIIHI